MISVNIKYIKTLTLLVVITTLFNCSSSNEDDDLQNEFTINGITYQALNASLGLDAGPSYNNQFSFIITDNLINVNAQIVPTISTSTTAGVAIFVKLGNTPLASEQDVINNITNSTFNLDDDTGAITNIINFSNIYTQGGVQYGELDETGAILYEMNTLGSGTVTINFFSANLTSRTGTVDFSFSFTDENGVPISGSYNGSFSIHDDR